MTIDRRTRWQDWIPVAAVLITIVGALLIIGKSWGEMQDNTRRIEALEARADKRDDQLHQIDVRTVRIEAKLDALTPEDRRSVKDLIQ